MAFQNPCADLFVVHSQQAARAFVQHDQTGGQRIEHLIFLPVDAVAGANVQEVAGLRREERPAVPDSVIREAVVNAVCHRDYSIANRRTAVYIFRDRLEIISPGRLPNTLTVEKILTGNSAPRNTFLLKYLDNMKFIDGLGRGVPMMHREMGERLRYQEEGEVLRLILEFKTPLR